MEIGQLLDAAKKAQALDTDMALAKSLGVGRAAVSAWRHGTRLPDPVACAALAGLSGMPLARVLGIVGEARAISREEKSVWRKLAASAAMVLVLLLATPLPAHASNAVERAAYGFISHSSTHSVYYVHLAGWPLACCVAFSWHNNVVWDMPGLVAECAASGRQPGHRHRAC